MVPDLAIGAVTAMAGAALTIGVKLLVDVLRTSHTRHDAEVTRLERRQEAERTEWAAERAQLRAWVARLEQRIGGDEEG